MKIKKNINNPFIFFLPFLLFAILLILLFSKKENFGDEIRYLHYAHNLTQGYFSNPYPYIDLGNGPGYPIIIAPLVAFHAPVILIKLLNSIFYYLSIVFLFKSLKLIVPFKFTMVFTLIWALYPNLFFELPHALPEIFSSSLVPIFVYCTIKGLRKSENSKNKKFLLAGGIILGFLILTKPIFAYVLIAMYSGLFIFWIFKIKNIHYKRTLIILTFAFITNVPYLLYTYHLTGKMFYWSSFGGNNLYWMSTPFKGEYGEYYRYPFRQLSDRIPGSADSLRLHHNKDFEEILQNPEVRKANIVNGEIQVDLSNGITQDDLLKEIAMRNIKSHPVKFFQNCISNAGRMLFNYPASYTLQKPSTLRRLPINGTLIVLAIFCIIPTLINWKKINFAIRFLLAFSLIYFGGSLLGSAEPRMLTKIVPILLIWIAFILSKTVKVKLKYDDA